MPRSSRCPGRRVDRAVGDPPPGESCSRQICVLTTVPGCLTCSRSAPRIEEDGGDLREAFGNHGVPRPCGPLLPSYQAGVGEHLEMVGHRWLRQPKRLGQVAHARLPTLSDTQQRQQLQPRGISNRLEEDRQGLGGVPVQRFGQPGRAALRPGRRRPRESPSQCSASHRVLRSVSRQRIHRRWSMICPGWCRARG